MAITEQERKDLRDMFACQAMQALLAKGPHVWPGFSWATLEGLAAASYQIADAMLSERECLPQERK